MAQIIPGSVIGTYKTTAVTLAMSKNENQRGIKAGIAILTVKDEGSAGAHPKTLMFFEGETISSEELAVFGKYKAAQPDAQGGYAVSLQALKAAPEDYKFMESWFSWPGGDTEDYKLRKGLCYGNDLEGKRSMKKDGTPVMTDTIQVFTQVKFFTPEPDGSLKPHYFAGLGLEEQGRRMEDRFFKQAVEGQGDTPNVDNAGNGENANTDNNNGGTRTPF